MSNTVLVEIRDVYGKPLIYPINAPAKTFAGISGTKTLSSENLKRIEMLGFCVEHKTRYTPEDAA